MLGELDEASSAALDPKNLIGRAAAARSDWPATRNARLETGMERLLTLM
jgi:hypothetical protein